MTNTPQLKHLSTRFTARLIIIILLLTAGIGVYYSSSTVLDAATQSSIDIKEQSLTQDNIEEANIIKYSALSEQQQVEFRASVDSSSQIVTEYTELTKYDYISLDGRYYEISETPRLTLLSVITMFGFVVLGLLLCALTALFILKLSSVSIALVSVLSNNTPTQLFNKIEAYEHVILPIFVMIVLILSVGLAMSVPQYSVTEIEEPTSDSTIIHASSLSQSQYEEFTMMVKGHPTAHADFTEGTIIKSDGEYYQIQTGKYLTFSSLFTIFFTVVPSVLLLFLSKQYLKCATKKAILEYKGETSILGIR